MPACWWARQPPADPEGREQQAGGALAQLDDALERRRKAREAVLRLGAQLLQQVGRLFQYPLRFADRARDAQRDLRTDGPVVALGHALELGGHGADRLPLEPLVLAELRLGPLRLRLADEVVVLGRLSLQSRLLLAMLGHVSSSLDWLRGKRMDPDG
jgi:hypothetical protein